MIVNGWKPLTIITKHSILDVAAALDPPLISGESFAPVLSHIPTEYGNLKVLETFLLNPNTSTYGRFRKCILA